MTQHINLLSKRTKVQSLVLLGPVLLPALILIMLISAGQTEWRLKQLRDEQASAQLKIEELKKVLESKRQVAGLNESQAMTREMTQLKALIEARKDWKEWLQKGELGAAQGYSGILRSLAGLREEGVWLTGVDITKGGQSLTLIGNATNADAVVRYIAQVNQAFKPLDIQFASMEITREVPKATSAPLSPAAAAGLLHFKLF